MPDVQNKYIAVVQDTTNDYTQVSTTLQTLINDNYISEEDIKAVNVVPLGTKFLVVVSYVSGILIGIVKSLSTKTGLRSKFVRGLITFNRTIKKQLDLITILKRKINNKFKILKIINLITKDPAYGLEITSKKISYILSTIEKTDIFSAKRKQLLTLNFGKNYSAWYNGVPIQL